MATRFSMNMVSLEVYDEILFSVDPNQHYEDGAYEEQMHSQVKSFIEADIKLSFRKW